MSELPSLNSRTWSPRNSGVGTRPLRVLHVVRQYAPAVGGLENFVACLAAEQRNAGLEAQVLTLNSVFHAPPAAPLPAHERLDGIPVRRLPWRGSHRYPLAPGVLSHLRDFDLVHVHGVDFFADFLAATQFLHRRPLLLSTHGGFFHTAYASRLKRLFFHTVTRWSLRRYAHVFACSEGDFSTFQVIRPNGMTLIENGVDTDKFRGAAAAGFQPVLAFVGRFSNNKRVDRLVRLVADLRERGCAVRLLVIGRDWDGNLPRLQEQVRSLGVQEAVEIHTGLSDEEIRTQLGRASFVASASEYEGFGMTLVEGLSAGLVPLASNIPSFEAIVERAGVGQMLDFTQPEAAASVAHQFIDQVAADHPRFRHAALQAASHWSWPATAERFMVQYDQIPGHQVRRLQGVDIAVMTGELLVRELDDCAARRRSVYLAFANAHTLNQVRRQPAYQNTLRHFLVVNDGVGMDIASRWRYGHTFPENLNGTDFVPRWLRESRQPLRVFLLGARPEVVVAAHARCRELFPRHDWVGHAHGYFRPEDEAALCERIRRAAPDVLLVAMGNPLQEHWIARCGPAAGAPVAIGVGALFDFWSGTAKRAPDWVRAMKLEWLYRLWREPRRMWRRYLLGNMLFLRAAWGDRQ